MKRDPGQRECTERGEKASKKERKEEEVGEGAETERGGRMMGKRRNYAARRGN